MFLNYRVCQRLSLDQFALINPTWQIRKLENGLYTGVLYLPTYLRLRNSRKVDCDEELPTKRAVKEKTALTAIRLLFDEGYIDKDLQPPLPLSQDVVDTLH